MAKKLVTTDEETPPLFPELDKADPKHKALLKLARDYDRKKRAHQEGIATLKETRDVAEQRLLSAMHEMKISGFVYDGIKVNIELGAEKALIKVDESVKEEDEETNEESEEK